MLGPRRAASTKAGHNRLHDRAGEVGIAEERDVESAVLLAVLEPGSPAQRTRRWRRPGRGRSRGPASRGGHALELEAEQDGQPDACSDADIVRHGAPHSRPHHLRIAAVKLV